MLPLVFWSLCLLSLFSLSLSLWCALLPSVRSVFAHSLLAKSAQSLSKSNCNSACRGAVAPRSHQVQNPASMEVGGASSAKKQLDFNEFGGAGLTWVGLGWAGLGLGQSAVVLASLNSCPNLTFLWQRVLLPMACPCVCVALGTVSTDFLLQHFWGKKFPKLWCGVDQHSPSIFLQEGGLHFARFKTYFKKKPLA